MKSEYEMGKKENQLFFFSSGNALVSVLAANVLMAAFGKERNWPEVFVRVFIEDAMGERVWVDHPDCKGFVDNIITAFNTKMPLAHGMFAKPPKEAADARTALLRPWEVAVAARVPAPVRPRPLESQMRTPPPWITTTISSSCR